MIFISYYTQNTPYEEVMKTHLLPSLKKWGLKYDIEAIPDLGNWQKNTSWKPTHILKMLLKHQEDVCFLDADATIEKYPELILNLPDNIDMACHILDWIYFWRKKKGGNNFHLLSGTLVFKYSTKVIKFIEEFVKECSINPNIWEQKSLQKVVESHSNINLYKLPPEYCCIKLTNGTIPVHYCTKEPVILHHQKSREYKNRRNK